MRNYKSIGIQAVALGGSFHELAGNTMGLKSEKMVPYKTHNEQINALVNGEIDAAVIAIDNTNSGRVQSSVDSLAGIIDNFRIIQELDLPIEQHALVFGGMKIEDIHILLSQKPALDQVEQYRSSHGLVRMEVDDTLLAAKLVAEGNGLYRGVPAAAVASSLAGEMCGLTSLGVINDSDENTTRFWLIAKKPGRGESGTHASIVLRVENVAGGLMRALTPLFEKGYNFTDIDSHLHATDRSTRKFFATVEIGSNDITADIAKMNEDKTQAMLLGIYDSNGTLPVPAQRRTLPSALLHDEWDNGSGLILENGSQIVYVEARDQIGTLERSLRALSGVNIVDMSRPAMYNGNGRGFYYVLGTDVRLHTVEKVVDSLNRNGVSASHLQFRNGKFVDAN